MSIDNILLLGKNKKRANLLSSLFKENQQDISVADDISQAESVISTSNPELILIEYQAIVDAERKKLIDLFRDARRTKFVVFDVPNDATRRLAFYRLGAYRTLSSNYDVEDIFYYNKNLLDKVKPDTDQKENRFSGSLQDFSLATLINNFGRDQRSGVLRIQTPVSSGKIYFNNGRIYHAVAGYRKEDDAVLYMLTWNKGRFVMSPLPAKEVHNHMQMSNIALMLHGEQVREEYFSRVKELGGMQKKNARGK